MLIWEGLKGISRWGILSDEGWKEAGLGLGPKSSPCPSFLIPEGLKIGFHRKVGRWKAAGEASHQGWRFPSPKAVGWRERKLPCSFPNFSIQQEKSQNFCWFPFFNNLLRFVWSLSFSWGFHPVLYPPPGRRRELRCIPAFPWWMLKV